jgi:hypothetical protein
VADFAMTGENGMRVRKNIWLGAGYEFKVRPNNEWNGDKGQAAEGEVQINTSIETGSNNIKIATEGWYDIWFDEAGGKIYVMTAGTAPGQ